MMWWSPVISGPCRSRPTFLRAQETCTWTRMRSGTCSVTREPATSRTETAMHNTLVEAQLMRSIAADSPTRRRAPYPRPKKKRDGKPETSAYSCQGFWKFINDPAGAYPPFLDGGATQYIQIHECEESETMQCNTKCYTGMATPNTAVSAAFLAASLAAVLMTAHA